MTVIVKAQGPVDILAMVPAMVGFVPRNSVVLLAFRGKRTCGAMRFDLPRRSKRRDRPDTEAVVFKRTATTMIGILCKLPAVDAVMIVIYTDDGFGALNAVPWSDFAAILGRRIEQSGFELRGSVAQAADGWASHFEPDVPPGGHPLAEIADSPVAAAIPAEHRPGSAPGDLPARIPDAEASVLARAQLRLATYRTLAHHLVDGSNVVDESLPVCGALAPLADLPLFAEDALDWNEAAIDLHGSLLVFAVQRPANRDAVMLQWASSLEVGDQLLGYQAAEGDPVPHVDAVDIGMLMLGQSERPDPDRIDLGITLLLHLVAQTADAERPPLLCMLAWLNWALGRGSLAGVYLAEALTIDPRYSMAQLLNTMTGNGLLPEWAFAGPPRPLVE